MMLVVAAITGLALYVALQGAARSAEGELHREFRSAAASLHDIEVVRRTALTERCRALARKSRIHAALEDNAPDLLYPSASDALRDVMLASAEDGGDPSSEALHAMFYRFLDADGAVLPPGEAHSVGALMAGEEKQIELGKLPISDQTGYMLRKSDGEPDNVAEIIAVPVFSSESGEVISAVVLGFHRIRLSERHGREGIRRGVWLGGDLHFADLQGSSRETLVAHLEEAGEEVESGERGIETTIGDVPHLTFFKCVNPGSAYPPAFEVYAYPLTELAATQRKLLWEILSAGAVLMLGGLGASDYLSRRLSKPVEELAESRRKLQETLDELRAAEQELVQSEKMAALGTLTNGLMHEINNPLNFAKSALYVLESGSDELPEELREEFGEFAGDIREGLDRIGSIVSDLRVFTRPETVSDADCAVSELANGALRILSGAVKEAGVEVLQDSAEEFAVCGDQSQLTLVFLNIIKNAIDAHEENRARRTGAAHVWITACARGTNVEVRIKDDGPGIPDGHLNQIFDPFFTTKPPGQGTGMGLSSVYRIVAAHGGTVHVRSYSEAGTEFVLRLPRATALSEPHPEPAPALSA